MVQAELGCDNAPFLATKSIPALALFRATDTKDSIGSRYQPTTQTNQQENEIGAKFLKNLVPNAQRKNQKHLA